MTLLIVVCMLGLYIVYLCTNYYHPSFSHSEDWIGAH